MYLYIYIYIHTYVYTNGNSRFRRRGGRPPRRDRAATLGSAAGAAHIKYKHTNVYNTHSNV